MAEREPAIRRLCVAASAGSAGLLTWIQQSGCFFRLYVMADPVQGVELAFASPGLDEIALVTDLIAAMHSEVMMATGLRRPVLAGFHVGITRVVGDGLGGTGADRTLALIRDPAILAASARNGSAALLVVAVTAGLFEELRAEGLSGQGWESVPAANAWLKPFASVADLPRPSGE